MDGALIARLLSLVTAMLLGVANASAEQSITFSPAAISQWPTREFAAPVDYSLSEIDGQSAVLGRCEPGGASALYLEQNIDLDATPILTWRWHVDALNPIDADERSKAGDDFTARIYAVHQSGLLPWQTQAINYVWSRNIPPESSWPNPFTAKAMMLAVQSGAEQIGQWQQFERNLKEDFQRLHDQSIDQIDGLAIMTDCDNTGVSSQGAIGAIRLHAQSPNQ